MIGLLYLSCSGGLFAGQMTKCKDSRSCWSRKKSPTWRFDRSQSIDRILSSRNSHTLIEIRLIPTELPKFQSVRAQAYFLHWGDHAFCLNPPNPCVEMQPQTWRNIHHALLLPSGTHPCITVHAFIKQTTFCYIQVFHIWTPQSRASASIFFCTPVLVFLCIGGLASKFDLWLFSCNSSTKITSD